MPENIGQLIKAARKRAGLTQVQLAERLDVTQGAIYQYEQSVDMQLSTVTKIAEALGLPVCQLLDCTPPPNPRPRR